MGLLIDVDSWVNHDDKAVKSAHVTYLSEAQTVIASVSFQYGVNLIVAAPKFWKVAAAQNWKGTVKVLKNFGDAYPTRRGKEATLLEKIVK